MTLGRKLIAAVALIAGLALAMPAMGGAATSKTLTVGAATPLTSNCWFLYEASNPGDDWRPYGAWIYMNIPPFQLKPGDTLAFDTGVPNDHDTQLDIALARTTANGNDVNAQPFTTVVNNTQTPANPRGNDVENDYEMRFTAQAGFDFPGGGLIIRVSHPGPSFLPDQTCDGQLVGDSTSDTNNFFVERAYQDADGVAPWDGTDDGPLAQFRLTLQPTSNALEFGKLTRNKKKGTATLPVTVPGPGSLSMTGKGVKAQTASARASVNAAGTVNLKVKAKGKKRARLLRRHMLSVMLTITFAPSGDPAGDPSSSVRKVKLLKKG